MARAVVAPARPFRAASQPRRQQLRVQTAVAALEQPAAAEQPELVEEVDSESLYRRFEELIDASMLSHVVGDRVRRIGGGGGRPRAAAGGGGGGAALALAHPSALPASGSPQVQGTVVRVDQRGAYVDIGGKSTAFCPTAELALANIPKVCGWCPPLAVGHLTASLQPTGLWQACSRHSTVKQLLERILACGRMPARPAILPAHPRPAPQPRAAPPQSTPVVGPHTCRDFIIIREERSGDLTLSLKRLELGVRRCEGAVGAAGCG